MHNKQIANVIFLFFQPGVFQHHQHRKKLQIKEYFDYFVAHNNKRASYFAGFIQGYSSR